MMFTEAKRRVIASLGSGNFRHVAREVAEGKNLLDSGEVSAAEVAELVGRCRGNQYAADRHDSIAGLEVHVFRPARGAVIWYIKAFFLDTEDGPTMFLSVHPSQFSRRR